MSISGKKAAKAFRKKYGIQKPTLKELKKIINSQGYTIIEFNAIFNDENVAAVIEELHLDEMISSRKGFIYADRNHRLLFVHEDLTADEKLSVLLHEEGHIFCGHVEENTYIGRDVQQESEANEFSYCLLNPNVWDRCSGFIRKNKVWLGLVSLLLTAGIVIACVMAAGQDPNTEYYITETGNKYHQSECIHVKNKTNVQKLTKKDLKSGEYEACGLCLPQE